MSKVEITIYRSLPSCPCRFLGKEAYSQRKMAALEEAIWKVQQEEESKEEKIAVFHGNSQRLSPLRKGFVILGREKNNTNVMSPKTLPGDSPS